LISNLIEINNSEDEKIKVMRKGSFLLGDKPFRIIKGRICKKTKKKKYLV